MLALILALTLGFQVSAPPVPRDTAVLRIGNRAVWVFRSPIGDHPPAERATLAAERIIAALKASSVDSLASVSTPGGAVIELNHRPVFAVLAADVDTAAGDSLPAAVLRAQDNLRRAVQEYRAARSWQANLHASVWALAATFLYVVLLWFIVRSRRWLSGKLEPLTGGAHRLTGRGVFSLLQSPLARVVAVTTRLAAWAVGILITDLYLTYVLTRFPWSRPWGELLGAYLTRTAASFALGFVHSIPDLFILLLIALVTRWVTGFVRRISDAAVAGVISLPGLHPDTMIPTRRIITVVIWLIALVFAYPHLPGSGSDAFKGISVFAGLVLSLGSTGIVNQWMSGLAVMYSRAFRPGDYVHIGDAKGTVVALGWLSTRIRTPWLEDVTLPNAVVVSQGTTNYSRAAEGGVLVRTGVTIGYDAPWRQVHALLLEAAAHTPGVRRDPAPYVRQSALSDFYVEYRLSVIVEPEQQLATMSALHANIQDSFNEHGVQIMSPHFRTQPDQPVVVPPANWYAPPAQHEKPRS